MDTLEIRQKLYEYIREAEDEKVEAMYTVIKDEVTERYAWWNDENLVAELDRRSADLKSGKIKGVSLEESKSYLLASLKKDGI
jgi:hypothetical protein